jgi:Xaa-Pro aminopeptidase
MGRTTTTKAGGSNRSAKGASDPISACKKCKRWAEIKQRMRVATFIEKTVQKVESKLENGEISPTVAEYLKLLQLEQEWEQQESGADGPKEIKVTWVGPVATSNSEK